MDMFGLDVQHFEKFMLLKRGVICRGERENKNRAGRRVQRYDSGGRQIDRTKSGATEKSGVSLWDDTQMQMSSASEGQGGRIRTTRPRLREPRA